VLIGALCLLCFLTDRLVGVPNAQPPLATDWDVRPTHPVKHVPYHVAAYWDRGVREWTTERTAALCSARKMQQRRSGTATGIGLGEVPRDLRESAKRRPAVRGWLRLIEEPVRRFLVEMRRVEAGGEPRKHDKDEDFDDEVDSEDEEILFVGRRAAREQSQWKMAHREVGDQSIGRGIVFDSLGDDEVAAFRCDSLPFRSLPTCWVRPLRTCFAC
jgi:hypothetical protein